MKKIISSMLAVLMVVSLVVACTVSASAADKEYTITTAYIVKPTDESADRCAVRYVFNITKDEMTTLNGSDPFNADGVWEGAGYEAGWGVGSGDDYTTSEGGTAPYQHGNWGEGSWLIDEKGFLCFQTKFDNLVGKTAGEEYAAAADGTLKAYVKDVSGSADLIHDSLNRTIPDLKPNTKIDDANAIVLTVITSEAYAEAAVVTDPATDAPTTDAPAPETADLTAAIAVVAVIALGTTAVVIKKKH